MNSTILDDAPWQGRLFTGSWCDAHGGVNTVLEPATGAPLATVGAAGIEDLTHSVEQARDAQRSWAAAPYSVRAAVLRRAGELWQQHSQETARWLIREAGATRAKAAYEVQGAAAECFEASSLPSLPLGEVIPSERAWMSMTRRVPVGVVAVIAPFNAPLKLAIRSVAPALALGNAVVLKPDPRTAVSGGVTIARIFEEAGLPAGVLHVLPGGGDIGSALVDHPAVRAVSFTGSTAAGRAVGQIAARRFIHTHLELGGNNALIVLEDADLDRAVGAAMQGTFFHQGQVCMASGRHLVHESIYEEFVQLLAERTAQLTVGDPTVEDVALGPIIDERQRDKIHALVTSSVNAGATLKTGGSFEGLFYRPAVLADSGPGIPAYDSEVFGPVAAVARFSTLDEAAHLAAASEYGLSLGILTSDVAAGLALAERIPTGTAHINDQTVNDEANAPFGGMFDSGTATRFGGAQANIEAYTETRWMTVRQEIPGYAM
ncbi:benzaldehyde dehydrogenase [Streptomyces sp. NPDC020362]|uniref:benzaldehyde dehydrogenase n=1 Tax=unclassified Streptomyces TaxID=2593676 RepID=UPI0033CAAE6F